MGVSDVSDVAVVRRQALKPLELLRRLRDPSPPVSGLLLDVGGVLYDDSVWSRWLLKLLTRLGLHTHYTPFFRMWQREYCPRIKRGECDYWRACTRSCDRQDSRTVKSMKWRRPGIRDGGNSRRTFTRFPAWLPG